MFKLLLTLSLLLFIGCTDKQTKSDTSKEVSKTVETIEEVQLQAIKTLYPQIYTTMQKVPVCLEKAQDESQRQQCGTDVKRLNKELAISMGYIIEKELPKNIQDIKKEEQIASIKKGLVEMKTTLECIESVESMAEVNGCLGE